MPCSTPPRRFRRFGSTARWAGLFVIGTMLAGLACNGRGGLRHPKRLGHGGVETCPEVRIAADPGHPHPDRVRCSYSDLASEDVARLAGSVVGERHDSPVGEPLADMRVSIHPFAESDDPRHPRAAIAEAISDGRGAFTIEAELARGEYLLVARARDADRVLAFSRLAVQDHPAGDRSGLTIIVPRKPKDPEVGESAEGRAALPAAPERPAWLDDSTEGETDADSEGD